MASPSAAPIPKVESVRALCYTFKYSRKTTAMTDMKHIPPQCEFDPDRLVVRLDELIASDSRHIEGAVSKVNHLLEENGCLQDLGNVQLALQEALMNAILHGNRSDPEKYVRLCVAIEDGGGIIIVVKDTGSGFDPSQLPDPTLGENILRERGRGVFLIQQLMDEVQFKFGEGTALIMRRHPPKRQS